MLIDLSFKDSMTKFDKIEGGSNFMFSGKLYLKFDRLIHLSQNQKVVDVSTANLDGYNAIRLSSGTPSSFQSDTPVHQYSAKVVRN